MKFRRDLAVSLVRDLRLNFNASANSLAIRLHFGPKDETIKVDFSRTFTRH
jgi:hypothetical protein